MEFARNSFGRRLRTMLHVDFRRMFTQPLLYILVASCLVMPILILVMTTMMDGTVSVDPQTGVETVVEGFDNTWQIIGSVSDSSAATEAPDATENTEAIEPSEGAGDAAAAMAPDMGLTAMCNINMLYFVLAVLVCIFVSEDFRSGYAKNLFTVRANKGDYIVSKTLVCILGSMLMLLAFFVGSVLGGAISGLPFAMEGFDTVNLVMCVLSKLLLAAVFVPIYLIMAVVAKQKLWLSLVLSMMTGMFLFMMIPMLTPLDATVLNVILCAAGGFLFSLGLGIGGKSILSKTSLV